MLVPEYNLADSSTWVPIREPSVDPSFDKELIKIAGLNDFGKPMLQRVWGCAHKDPMNANGALKYFITHTSPVLRGFEYIQDLQLHFVKTLAEVPASILIPVPKYTEHQLGERRWVIEQYRSPTFLRKSKRYEITHDTGDTFTQIACRSCGSHRMKPTGREDERECLECGSKRQSIVEVRENKNERLLNDFPAEGCYDYFLRLETEAGLYHPADAEALEFIRRLWRSQQKPFAEQEADLQEMNQLAAKDTNRRINEIWAA